MGRKTDNKGKLEAKRKRRRSRSKYTLYYIILLIALIAVMAILSLTVFFNVEVIVLEGSSHYTEEELLKSAGIAEGDNLFRISEAEVHKTLVNKHPYIKSVELVRTLPSTLKLEVVERQSVALVEFENKSYILDDAGRVLNTESLGSNNQFHRTVGIDVKELKIGDFIAEEEMSKYDLLLSLINHLAENGLWVDVIDMSDISSIKMLYDGRVAVLLGGISELDYKIRFAATAINGSLGESFVGFLDVSTRPMARVRTKNIFLEEEWPFPIYLLKDYEREIEKNSIYFGEEIISEYDGNES